MDYNLAARTQRDEDLNLNVAMNTGYIPYEMLMSKFEETDIGGEETAYDDYARREIVDFGPDRNLFEHEMPRGPVNRQYGRIQLQYYGHRGDANDPAHPEMFLGFAGPEDVDPRGINVDPDMTRVQTQHEARNRFVRLSSDMSESVTGGGRSFGMIEADKQTAIRRTRNQLKVFDRQLDGRREGLRRVYEHRPELEKQNADVVGYGDVILDYALTPQRRAILISKKLIRDTAEWRDDTADTPMGVNRYGEARRRRARENRHNPTDDVRGDTDMSDETRTKCYKAMGILMSDIIAAKREAQADGEYGDSVQEAARKSRAATNDLMMIIRAVDTTSEFGANGATAGRKTPYPKQAEHLATVQVANHMLPAHHYLNAALIYKSAKSGEDASKVRENVITKASEQVIADTARSGKTTKRDFLSGGGLKLQSEYLMTEDGLKTHNYKRAKIKRADESMRMSSGEDFKQEGDPSQIRRPNHKAGRVTTPDETMHDTRFDEYKSSERMAAPLGSKYTMREIDRDDVRGDIAQDS